jgi:serine/threonine protein kinase
MSVILGTTLGPYSVTAKIGEGGMGEVHRARDTKLDRDVALKVLPQAFTDDPDRLARFEREAKVLASLNHPNIGHIYGLEEAEGTRALVLRTHRRPDTRGSHYSGLDPNRRSSSDSQTDRRSVGSCS